MSWKRIFNVGDEVRFIRKADYFRCEDGQYIRAGATWNAGRKTKIKHLSKDGTMFVMSCDDTLWHKIEDIELDD